MDRLPVNEIFDTIQGEAIWTGTPSVFVRLQGCKVGCPWCDTKHTWSLAGEDYGMGAAAIGVPEMMAKVIDGATYAEMTVTDILEICRASPCGHIVITGGEPCDYDLLVLTTMLYDVGKTVQIETSGTSEVRAVANTWVTVSPKIGMPGGKTVRQDAVDRANEIKMPVGKPDDIEKLRAFLTDYGLTGRINRARPRPLVWLQPLSKSEKATSLCLEAATANGWRLSMQTHKYLGVR